MTTYIIKKTDNHTLCEIADGTADTIHSSLVLFGKNYAGYGPQLDENFVKLLENFSFSSPPAHPIQGQLWWDSQSKILRVYTLTDWKVISGSNSSPMPPSSAQVGDLWWDTDTSQLKIYDNASWVVVGPLFTKDQGTSGPIASTVTATSDSSDHVVIKFFIGGTVVAVLSSDTTFTTNDIPGFSTIRPGFNLPTANGLYVGDSENALRLGNVLAANFLRSDVISTTNHKLNVLANAGLDIGLANDLSIKVEGSAVKLVNNVLGSDTEFYVKGSSGLPVLALKLNTGDGTVIIPNAPSTGLAAVNKDYVDSTITSSSADYLKTDGSNFVTGDIAAAVNEVHSLGTPIAKFKDIYSKDLFSSNVTATNITVSGGIYVPTTNTIDIGTPTKKFRNFYGTAMMANYADLAENYVADANYPPGTVLDFGGAKEVTLSTGKDLTKVAGVVSTNPAYLMNAECAGEFVVAVALQGRVPCRVIGQIAKGDLLVSYGDGIARRHLKPDPGTIIGKALEAHAGEESVIEIVVGKC